MHGVSLQDELEATTARRIADAARVIEELRSELNDEQLQLHSKDAEHAQLHSQLQQLQAEHEKQQGQLTHSQHSAQNCQEELSRAKGQASDAEHKLAALQSRCALPWASVDASSGTELSTLTCLSAGIEAYGHPHGNHWQQAAAPMS